jgi:lysophospholipase L1-like esterase
MMPVPSHRLFLLLLWFSSTPLLACAQVTSNANSVENTAIVPAERGGAALTLFEQNLKRTKAGPIDLLFLGDSITQGWNENDVWDRYYAPRNAANFAIGGNRTQHLLWQLEHGELEGISPKIVVLMIGTNNIHTNTPEEIAEGIRKILDVLRSRLPETRVLLLGVFPRGQKPAPVRDRIGDLNRRIAEFDDGKMIKYLDISSAFLGPDGTISREVMPDFLHISEHGYQLWADAMEPSLWEMLEGN